MPGPTIIAGMLKQQNHQCYYCARTMFKTGKRHPLMPTVEHLHRRADGGDNSSDNMVMACLECNSHRGDYDVDTWRRVCLQVIRIRKHRKQVLQKINHNISRFGGALGLPKNKVSRIKNQTKKMSSRVLAVAETVQVRIAA